MGDAVPGEIVASGPFSNKGIVMENAVAATLVKKRYPLYYDAKKNSTLEIDFVTGSSSVNLIEVKSGRNKRSRSLDAMLSEKDRNRRGFKICEGNIETDRNGAVHLPIYAACFLPESAPPEIPPVTGPTEKEIEARLGDYEREDRGDAFKSDRQLRDVEAPSGMVGPSVPAARSRSS